MNWKSTAVVSGATVLATWLGWPPARQPASPTYSSAARESPAAASSDIQEQAKRLQTRVRNELDYRDPARNPFRFAPRPAPAVSRGATDVPAPLPAAVPEVFPYTLSGMAADRIDGQLTRTAIVTSASELLLVREGDHVANCVVTRVDENALELTAPDGAVHRLALTP